MLTILAPMSAMAAPAAMNNNSNLTYEATKKTVIEKARGPCNPAWASYSVQFTSNHPESQPHAQR